MGNNNYFDELIASYLAGELDAEEEAFVLEWINSTEENKQQFESLRRTWNLLAGQRINVDAEWDHFKQSAVSKPAEFYDIKPESFETDSMGEAVSIRKQWYTRILISTAIAASIVLIILSVTYFTSKEVASEKPIAFSPDKQVSAREVFLQMQFNESDKSKELRLQDGSEVKLYSKSELDYYEPFIGNERNIKLTGKADFTVAKDKTKPFTVVSGNISTTALGTKFTVTAIKNAKNIIVRLYEGKVVVRLSKLQKSQAGNQFFLFPGQELTYNNESGIAKVRTFGTKVKAEGKSSKDETSVSIDNPSIPKSFSGSWYMFNNQSLDEVFAQLEDMYGVDIVYKKKDVAKMYFIGTFNTTDSIDLILQQITILNNLKVTKENNKIIISK